jgi:hypothetical protein
METGLFSPVPGPGIYFAILSLRLCRKMNWNVLELFKLIEKWTQGFARQKRPVLTVFAVIYINCFISQPQGGEKQWMRY